MPPASGKWHEWIPSAHQRDQRQQISQYSQADELSHCSPRQAGLGATGVRWIPTGMEHIVAHVPQASSSGGFRLVVSETSSSPLAIARCRSEAGKKWDMWRGSFNPRQYLPNTRDFAESTFGTWT